MSIPGSNIRTLRQQLNISLKNLANAIGMDKGGLSKMERGETGYSRETLEKIAKVLGVSLGVLFAEPAIVETAAFPMRRVPLLTAEQLLHWQGPDVDANDEPELLYGSLHRMSRYCFGLRVPEPAWDGFLPGTDLIFDAKKMARRACVVAALDAAGHVFVGRLRLLMNEPDVEIWPFNALDPIAASRTTPGFTIRGVLIEERRYAD